MQEFHGRRGRELGGAFPDNIRTQLGVKDREYQALLRDFVARRPEVVRAQIAEHLAVETLP